METIVDLGQKLYEESSKKDKKQLPPSAKILPIRQQTRPKKAIPTKKAKPRQ